MSWLRSTGNPFVNEIASFYTSYMVREEDGGEGTAWMAWPRVLGALPKTPLTCPQHTVGAKAAQCIVSKQLAGRLCYALPNCSGIAYTTDAAWNKRCVSSRCQTETTSNFSADDVHRSSESVCVCRYPGACMLSAGPPVASGPAGSAWDVASWASHTKPTVNPKVDSDKNSTVYTWNIPKSCSMELCTLGGFGASLEQANPALELPLVRRVLSAAVHFSALLYPKPDEAQKIKVSRWTDILEHLAPLPLTTITTTGTIGTTKSRATTTPSVSSKGGHTDWVWAETNVSSAAAFGANQWYPLDYFSPMHPGNGVGLSTRVSDPETFALARRTVAGTPRWTDVHISLVLLSLLANDRRYRISWLCGSLYVFSQQCSHLASAQRCDIVESRVRRPDGLDSCRSSRLERHGLDPTCSCRTRAKLTVPDVPKPLWHRRR
jgi:hypothetical protein